MTDGIDGDIKVDENSSYACSNATVQLNTTGGQDNQVSCEKNHTIEIYDGEKNFSAMPIPATAPR